MSRDVFPPESVAVVKFVQRLTVQLRLGVKRSFREEAETGLDMARQVELLLLQLIKNWQKENFSYGSTTFTFHSISYISFHSRMGRDHFFRLFSHFPFSGQVLTSWLLQTYGTWVVCTGISSYL